MTNDELLQELKDLNNKRSDDIFFINLLFASSSYKKIFDELDSDIDDEALYKFIDESLKDFIEEPDIREVMCQFNWSDYSYETAKRAAVGTYKFLKESKSKKLNSGDIFENYEKVKHNTINADIRIKCLYVYYSDGEIITISAQLSESEYNSYY